MINEYSRPFNVTDSRAKSQDTYQVAPGDHFSSFYVFLHSSLIDSSINFTDSIKAWIQSITKLCSKDAMAFNENFITEQLSLNEKLKAIWLAFMTPR